MRAGNGAAHQFDIRQLSLLSRWGVH
jgi:hypothetical protein